MSDFDLNAFLPYQLAVLAGRVSSAFAERYRDEFGISTPEWRVVAHLNQASEVSVREITERVDMDKSKVSRAASRLEAAGYVTKTVDSGDRRLVSLSLTEKGRRMMRALAPMARDYEEEVMAGLGDNAAAFRESLHRLLETTDPEARKP